RTVHAPDGSAIAVVMQDGSIRVCDVATGRERPELRSHSDAVGAATFSADSKSLFVASDSGRVQEWDARTGRQIVRHTLEPHVRNLAVSPDGQRIVGSVVPERPAGASQPGRGARGVSAQ